MRVRASSESLHCALEEDTLILSLLSTCTGSTHEPGPDINEKLLIVTKIIKSNDDLILIWYCSYFWILLYKRAQLLLNVHNMTSIHVYIGLICG